MNLPRLVTREILYRKLSFLTSLGAVAAAVACLTASVELLEDHDLVTEQAIAHEEAETRRILAENERVLAEHEREILELLRAHEDETRKNMKDLGFNVLILPQDQNLADLFAEDFASKYMPESYAEKLANANVVTVNHLLPSLTQKLIWPEKKRTIILTGVRGEVPILHRDEKKPILDAVPPGGAVLGHELAESLEIAPGDEIELHGRKLRVAKCYPPRGDKDDITVWIELKVAQEILDKPGLINAIWALECNCTAERLHVVRKEIAGILPDTQVIEKGTQATVRAEQRMKAAELARATRDAKLREREEIARQRQEITRTKKESRDRLREEREGFAAALAPLAVAGSAVLVAVLAFLNVRERRAEIGVLRALGLGAAPVLGVFVSRALAIGLAGAALGFPCGHAIAVWLGESDAARGVDGSLFDPALLALTLLIAPLVAVLASWLPALAAARQDPAEVLREA
jgi:ABC-type lipoprotein release transport system permease subunit